MRAKKEIILIIGIVIISIILIFLPIIINNTKSNTEDVITTVEESNTITITVVGEITYQPVNSINDDEIINEISFEAKSGISYGEIINRISNYLTKYSVIEDNLTNRYYKSTEITISSSNVTINDEEIDPNANKININTATFNQLTTLSGIGTKRANKILEYINENGSINTFSELKTILGVSDEVIENIKDEAFL